jgi:hypothetical protein
VVILTTSLIGAYDLDFTLLSGYYASHSLDQIPSIYVDLQLPAFDSNKKTQPNLRLRLPNYNEDTEGVSKIDRLDLIDPLDNSAQTTSNIHQLPYLYHFDMEKHRHPPSKYRDLSSNKSFSLFLFCRSMYFIQCTGFIYFSYLEPIRFRSSNLS